MAGKHAGRAAGEQEYDEVEPAPAPVAAPAPAAAPPPMSGSDRVQALKDLKDLLDAGAINQDEFDSEKGRLLHSGP